MPEPTPSGARCPLRPKRRSAPAKKWASFIFSGRASMERRGRLTTALFQKSPARRTQKRPGWLPGAASAWSFTTGASRSSVTTPQTMSGCCAAMWRCSRMRGWIFWSSIPRTTPPIRRRRSSSLNTWTSTRSRAGRCRRPPFTPTPSRAKP